MTDPERRLAMQLTLIVQGLLAGPAGDSLSNRPQHLVDHAREIIGKVNALAAELAQAEARQIP